MAEDQETETQEQVEAQTVTLTLTVNEVNQLLKILGEQPFKDVNGLVQKVYTQGSQQVNQEPAE